jgi:transposase
MQEEETGYSNYQDRELYAIYDAGREVTVQFIKTLIERIRSLEIAVEKQAKAISELKQQLGKNSHNSNKPPSSDNPFDGQKTKSLRKKTGKKPGGQEGHPGKTLRKSKNPNRTENISPKICRECGSSLEYARVISVEKRQVFDIPKPELTITEFINEERECGCCGATTGGVFPFHALQNVQYGPNIRAMIAYFRQRNFIPTERMAEIFSDLFGLSISEATFINTTRKCSDLLSDHEVKAIEILKASPVIHCDETGIKVNGRLFWIHNVSNDQTTVQMAHEKRGKEAINAMGILPSYTGTAIHDSWQSYFDYACNHGLCNAHHLRELTFVETEIGQKWAGRMINLLLEMKKAAEKALILNRQVDKRGIEQFMDQYHAILRTAIRKNPIIDDGIHKRGRKKKSKTRNLVDRLRNRWKETCAFLFDVRIPFDNNQAERDIRMTKVQQKVSGGFRSSQAAKDFCRIRGFLSTLRKQGFNVFGGLVNLFQNVCVGHIWS